MGDSDDEREFGKRRDKFHTERRGQDRGDDDRRGGFGGLFFNSSWCQQQAHNICMYQEVWTGAESQGQDHQWALEEGVASGVVVVHRWVGLGAAVSSAGEIDSRRKEAGGTKCPHLQRG